MNAVIESLTNHRSVRKYRPQPIEPDKMDAILEAATRAATAGNLQMYTLLVIDRPEDLKRLDEALEVPFIERSGCPAAILALVDLHRVKSWINLHTEREIVCNRPYNFFMAIWDALIAMQNAVAAAESLGLGTCCLGSGVELDIQQLFGAPELVFPAGLVCLGYPEALPQKSMRLPLEAVVHRNCYHLPKAEDINRWYDERDHVWDKVPEERKNTLAQQNIHGIAEALSVQKFSREIVEKRSRGILKNLRQSGFDLRTGLDQD
ncbi:MAG TPA: nitroreductase family protein [candidate division Zixibacteria bacterium]|nr:nitroreductase family protein [candidate division Zixibacteria bacterium]